MQGIENFSMSFESFSSPKNCEFFSCSMSASEDKNKLESLTERKLPENYVKRTKIKTA
jgi:hypothetical protein